MNRLKDDRNWFLVLLFSFITFGIYSIYFLHVQIRDTNIACANDGKKTSGMLKLIFLGILTFGIYIIVWNIKLVLRWQSFIEANNEKSPYTLVIHIILNYVLSVTGIVLIIDIVLRVLAFNKVCRIYNETNGRPNTPGGSANKDNKPNPVDNLWGWKDSPSSKM